MNTLWAACPSSDLCVASFDEASFYFYRPTGETHLLNAFPREVFDRVKKQPLTTDTIAKELATLCDEENSAQWQQKIKDVLIDLKMLGLIIETYS